MSAFLTDKELKCLKWYDYLWLLIPIAGIAVMIVIVSERARLAETSSNQL